jgi:hypothetical protein
MRQVSAALWRSNLGNEVLYGLRMSNDDFIRRDEGVLRRAQGGMQHLPSLSGLSADDEIYARAMLALAETGAMFRGRYVEAHVARLLGAVFPDTGINEWDLMIPGDPPILLEVKASAPRGRFDLTRIGRPNELVWVFVRIDSPMGERPSEFTYSVAGPRERREIAASFGRSAGVATVLGELGAVRGADLQSAVQQAVQNAGSGGQVV